ncbi:MAG: adenylate/guanylate cyclase domain-containing protein [Synechococcaceae cyanobacterium]|nr:adenylate/guanylate cyclase domain-containing protein [Synechococcaceae cyanobacterium]
MKRRLTTALLSAAVLAWVGHTAGWPGPRWRVWERAVEDQRLLWRGPRLPPQQLLLVPIDDASLKQGSWFLANHQVPSWARGIDTLPWPRAAYGRLAELLLQAGARAVAINVVFEGPSADGPDDDAALAATLARHRGRIALAAEMLEPSDSQGAGELTLVRPERFLNAAGGAGAFGLTNVLPASPGLPLRHPDAYGRGLLPAQGGVSFPSLSATLLRQAGLRSRQHDPSSQLNPYGAEGSFRRLPAWEVLDPERWRIQPLRHRLAGSLVLIGPVVSEGDDGYPTPFGPLSGLELLATASANSLQGDGLRPWPARPEARALLAVAPLLLLAAAALLRSGLRWRLGLVLLGLVGLLLASSLALNLSQRWLPLLAPASGLVLLGLLYGADAYLWEGRERLRLRRTFERYVAPGVVAEILADPAAAQGVLRGRLLEVTVLLSDLRNFTTLTRERSLAGQPELHVRQLNQYLGAMVEVISAHGGTIDKFIGDAVLAVFGSPISRGPGAEALAALRCALAMRQALAELNAAWLRDGITPLENGIGLASGAVMAGQIGSPRRLEFTVIGDTVNRAARLEALTRPLASPVLLDAATADLLAGSEAPPLRDLGRQPLKGLEEVQVFAPLTQGDRANSDIGS